jgi:hypothetical protein
MSYTIQCRCTIWDVKFGQTNKGGQCLHFKRYLVYDRCEIETPKFIAMESRLPNDFRAVLDTETCFKNILRAVLDTGGSF